MFLLKTSQEIAVVKTIPRTQCCVLRLRGDLEVHLPKPWKVPKKSVDRSFHRCSENRPEFTGFIQGTDR